MALKVTRWSPDTCNCVIDYEWDTDSPEDVRVHTPVAAPRICADHAPLAVLPNAHAQAYGQVLKENQSKNNVREVAAQTLAKLRKTLPGGGVDLADSVNYSWAFTGTGIDRQLTVAFTGVNLTGAEKTQLRNAIASAATQGKVQLPVTLS